MRKIEIEAWALRVIDAVDAARPSEDDRVEMKSAWLPDDHDFARRIAGHANAARGEAVLWLFGVDEKSGKAPGVQTRDAASWWPRVEAFFDGPAPRPVIVNVSYEDAVVVAILLETDHAPYVVKNPLFGTKDVKISHEVPCKGRMKLLAVVTNPERVARYLAAVGELQDVPARSPSRGPPYWKSTVLRRKARDIAYA